MWLTLSQFHQHFKRTFFKRKCFAQFFSSYVLAKKALLYKNTHVKCWWNWPLVREGSSFINWLQTFKKSSNTFRSEFCWEGISWKFIYFLFYLTKFSLHGTFQSPLFRFEIFEKFFRPLTHNTNVKRYFGTLQKKWNKTSRKKMLKFFISCSRKGNTFIQKKYISIIHDCLGNKNLIVICNIRPACNVQEWPDFLTAHLFWCFLNDCDVNNGRPYLPVPEH